MDENEKTPISDPHDRFFKKLFSIKANVEDFLRGELPQEITQNLDFQSLSPDENSYVDDELRKYFADVVYQCQYAPETSVKIAFLFEHKSYLPDFPHIQLLRYILNIWEYQIRNGEALQPIIPVLIYHGEKKWNIGGFESQFQGGKIDPLLRQFIPSFDFWLFNLQSTPNEELESKFQHLTVQIYLWATKNIFSSTISDELSLKIQELIRLQAQPGGDGIFQSLYLYLFNAAVKTERHKIKDVMEKIPVHEALEGSPGWQWMQEGIQKGMQEGIQKGIQKGRQEGIQKGITETAIKGLKLGLTVEVVSQITGLTIGDVTKLKASLD